MKRFIASSIFVLVKKPFDALRRLSKDNFALGLLLGAVFSLLVNIATVQLQEHIQRQRVLEALEGEVLSSVLQANYIVSSYGDGFNENGILNYFYFYQRYSLDLWEQSSEPRQYAGQLDPKIQSAITSYYTITLKNNNYLLDKVSNLSSEKLINCYFIENLSTADLAECKKWSAELKREELQSANDVATQGFNLLKDFHPTYDRVHDPLLSFLMGKNSPNILLDRQ